ncbi:putative anti-sigma-YlaC factor YlaD [Undibacterium sp. GrIS 1.8]|uniref:zf-HC2 domain-containing protein n=1 Tax=unclassified Undibacterium TaxID=2630295 RepID=UPI003398DABA
MRLLLTCKQAHQMVSEGLDRELKLGERTRLKMHLTMCDACTNFNGQMRLLRKAMRQLPMQDDSSGPDRPK